MTARATRGDSAAAALLATAAAVTAVAQLWCTVKDRNAWPLCSYNMFNRTLPPSVALLKVRLLDGSGEEPLRDVWGLLPLEFFRVQSVLAEVFLEGEDPERQRALAEHILERLNDRPWRPFDEVHGAYRPAPGRRFVGLRLYLAECVADEYDREAGGPLSSCELVYALEPAEQGR